VPYELIWRELESAWGATFTSTQRRAWDVIGEARLIECDRCGLEYFSPLLAGDAWFYEELGRGPRYYVDDRWEFGEVVSALQPTDTVVDFGSGRGAFLRRAAAVAERVIGCDHNEDAPKVDVPRAELRHEPFEDVAASLGPTADVATSFHVLEHLSDVDDLCGPATSCLRPGGRLFLSTPDRQRTVRDTMEVLDCPPHHLSRWSSHQYEVLAERYGMELASIRYEPFVHVRGVRRFVPRPLLHAGGIVRNRTRGLTVRGPRTARGGPWPRGTAILAELVKR
jgi:2-polyprenyl-3-methyl-5-hydroxy-6-metoxy-1,4-benzoquinol methylase